MKTRVVLMASLVIWGLYAVALATPAMTWTDGMFHESLLGYEALFGGWGWPGTIPELANIALVVAWIALIMKRFQVSVGWAILAIALALTAPGIYADASHPGWRDWIWRTSDVPAGTTDAGFPTHIGWGYWFWLGSMVALLLAGLSNVLKEGISINLGSRYRFTLEFEWNPKKRRAADEPRSNDDEALDA